jgi:hypothetical protein
VVFHLFHDYSTPKTTPRASYDHVYQYPFGSIFDGLQYAM